MTTKLKTALRSTCVAASIMTICSVAAQAEPKTNMMHQWAQGAEAAAIAKLGEMFEAAGGIWEQTAISGHTSNTLAKLRSDVVAGTPPLRFSSRAQKSPNGTPQAPPQTLTPPQPHKAGTRLLPTNCWL